MRRNREEGYMILNIKLYLFVGSYIGVDRNILTI